MKALVSVLTLLLSAEWNFGSAMPADAKDPSCSKPADVIFVLDSSGSIWESNFKRQIQFVTDVISHFPIGRDSIQVGAVSFSNWAQAEFYLRDFDTEVDIRAALKDAIQMKGDTNTAAALAFVQDVMLTSEYGARPHVPHVVVVLTDGKSNNPQQTVVEAVRVKKRSDVHLFAIGVGKDADYKELTRIASEPSDQHVFTVKTFAALETIKDLLAIKACRVTNPPQPLVPTSVSSVQVDQACGLGVAADVLFAASPSADVKGTSKTVKFFKEIAARLDIGPGKVRVGLVPKDCNDLPEMLLRDFNKKTVRQLRKRSLPSTAHVLRYINELGFAASNGGRDRIKRSSLLIVDGPFDSSNDVIKEAMIAKMEKNIELFVVGVGKGLATDDLKAIASSPPYSHVFHVSDYDELPSIVETVSNSICPVSFL